jgi:hypothetical protein
LIAKGSSLHAMRVKILLATVSLLLPSSYHPVGDNVNRIHQKSGKALEAFPLYVIIAYLIRTWC